MQPCGRTHGKTHGQKFDFGYFPELKLDPKAGLSKMSRNILHSANYLALYYETLINVREFRHSFVVKLLLL